MSGRLKAAGVLGLNRRNGDYILRCNDRSRFPLVDDKVKCKKCLQQHGLAVPDLIGLVSSMRMASHVKEILESSREFVIKPANGSGGDGIMVITDRRKDYFVDNDGKLVEHAELQHHLTDVIGGLYSLGGQPDVAMIETLVHFDPAFTSLTYHGVPDIRLIVYQGYPAMAMTRLPTRLSHGKANLHQGAIGVGIDLGSGVTVGGVSGDKAVSVHPDTGADIAGFQIPGWGQLMTMSAQCFEAVGLGYLGVDIVLDRDLGPLILELNARPGLSIQIANRQGLKDRLVGIDDLMSAPDHQVMTPEQRADWSARQFGDSAVGLLNPAPW